jgi:hypothetical protein
MSPEIQDIFDDWSLPVWLTATIVLTAVVYLRGWMAIRKTRPVQFSSNRPASFFGRTDCPLAGHRFADGWLRRCAPERAHDRALAVDVSRPAAAPLWPASGPAAARIAHRSNSHGPRSVCVCERLDASFTGSARRSWHGSHECHLSRLAYTRRLRLCAGARELACSRASLLPLHFPALLVVRDPAMALRRPQAGLGHADLSGLSGSL